MDRAKTKILFQLAQLVAGIVVSVFSIDELIKQYLNSNKS